MATASNTPPHFEPNPSPPEPGRQIDASRKAVEFFSFTELTERDDKELHIKTESATLAIQLPGVLDLWISTH